MSTKLKCAAVTGLLFFLSASAFRPANAQNFNVREDVRNDWNKASGLDNVYDFDTPELTPAPQGYEPFYVSHYGRHGSRYAYTSSAYTVLLKLLREEADNLTPYGQELLSRLEAFYPKVQYHTGDLTRKGWEQHQEIARRMVQAFPSAFTPDARVDAVSSPSTRAIVSMGSFCSSLSREVPSMSIYAHQGLMEQQATAPNQGNNPLKLTGPDFPFPFAETPGQFFLRRFPDWKNIYKRMFIDADRALGKHSPLYTTEDVYMLVAGMNSLDADVRDDFSDIFLPEEYATMWECDNYVQFKEYWGYRTPCSSVVSDMLDKADERIASGERGADLRFGHDHVLMSLYLIMDIDHFANLPSEPDSLACWFRTYDSPMAGNIQMVFYRPLCGQGDILVKMLRNGVETSIGNLTTCNGNLSEGPYYRWQDVEAFLRGRIRSLTYTQEERAALLPPAPGPKVSPQWQRDTISSGLVYHSYRGYEPLSDSYQFVNVVEVDMNNPRYRIKFEYEKTRGRTTSEAAKAYNAVAAINATYEPTSVFIRTDDTTWFNIPNALVMDTPVPQWRNDGGVYCDKTGRKIRIEAAGTGLNLEQTRKIYTRRSRKWPNIFTSAPMLIDDYAPTGKTFAEKGLAESQIEKIHYEDPLRHQHVRHPRTAIALSSDNHVYLVTVDGRWGGFADGMNAAELTSFLAEHFNPRYALNLDGGGSTTMVVRGYGDASTNVVNYPTDNKIFNHSGERRTCTHICVLDLQKTEK